MGRRIVIEDFCVGAIAFAATLAAVVRALPHAGLEMSGAIALAAATSAIAFWDTWASGDERLKARGAAKIQAPCAHEPDLLADAEPSPLANPASAPSPVPSAEEDREETASPAEAVNDEVADAATTAAETEAASSAESIAPTEASDDAIEIADDELFEIPERSRVDIWPMAEGLMHSFTPLEDLSSIVEGIRRRERATEPPHPCDAELFLAQSLEEAGLLLDDIELPHILVIPDGRTGLIRLLITEPSTSYLAMQRVLSIETALRRLICADIAWDDISAASQSELHAFAQGLYSSVVTQVGGLDVGDITRDEERPDGEWAVRRGISLLLESLQTPVRLVADYRVNMEEGVVAIQVEVPNPELMPKSAWSAELDRVIPTTADMRRQAASAYGLRLGILLARGAAWCSEKIREVHVAGVRDTASRHACYYSACFDRAQLEGLDVAHVDDPYAIYEQADAIVDVRNCILQPVTPHFSLEDERFCPASRYDVVELSGRALDWDVSQALGARSVSDLGINGDRARARMADEIMRSIAPGEGATERSVRLILDAVSQANDPSLVRDARRTVSKLIDGQIGDADAVAIGEEFARGDELTQAVDDAVRDIIAQRPLDAAIDRLQSALLPYDGAGAFNDTAQEEWRTFGSYVERTLYNRLFAHPEVSTRLVPQGYYHAHLMLSNIYLMRDQPEEALEHSRRSLALCPLDERATLRLVRCQEMLGRTDDAIESLKALLRIAHDAESIGVGYYRMAFMQWRKGRPRVAAACYLRSLQFASTMFPAAAMEINLLYENYPGEDLHLASSVVKEELEAAEIPLAPTAEVEEVLLDGAKATLDANIFPAARDFANALGALTGDAVVRNIFHSLEHEPDR